MRDLVHDVRAVDEERRLDKTPDVLLLELALAEGRILVTANVRHFQPLVARWSREDRRHAGCIFVPSSIR